MWRKNNYKSCNIEIDSDDNSDDDDELDDDDDGDVSRKDIHYVSGDVTVPRQTDCDTNIIIHCAGMLPGLNVLCRISS